MLVGITRRSWPHDTALLRLGQVLGDATLELGQPADKIPCESRLARKYPALAIWSEQSMTKTRIGIAVLLLAALTMSGVWGLAGDDDDAAKQDDRSNIRVDRDNKRDDDRPRDGDRRRNSDRHRDTDRPGDRDRPRNDDQPMTDAPNDVDSDTHHLGRTVKLEFTIIGEEEPSFIVLCAANNYVISHDVAGPDHEHAIELVGEVHPTDDPDRISLTFEAMTHHGDHNEGFDATFRAEGSASVKIGKKTTLATLGEEPLTVTATVEQ